MQMGGPVAIRRVDLYSVVSSLFKVVIDAADFQDPTVDVILEKRI